jgi:hypothetical protein
VFTRTNSIWSQQGGKLTGSGEIGNGQFGASVALSSDGSTALIGGHSDDASKGAAWAFTRTNSVWSQQGAKLTGSGQVGAASFGYSVALSAEGSTALIGGYGDATDKGAAWVFTRSGGTWSQQGAKLTGIGETGNGQFGDSVALSADGNTALIGGSRDDTNKGAAWVFTRSGSTWSQQGGKLTGSGETGDGRFGIGVALSGDGNTALIGGYLDDTNRGAAWEFTRSGTAWNQHGDKLTARGASGAARFGYSMALSADAKAALIGGYSDDANKGAAWFFSSAPPDVTGISPASGPAAGGTLVTISGTAFTAATGVKFGSAAATLSNVVSDSQIRAVSPPGQAGTVDVTVTGPTGTSAPGNAAKFTYTGPATTTTTAAADKQRPSAPRSFAGRYVTGTLRLSWARSADNVGVKRYQLYSNGAPWRSVAGSATRTSIRRFHPARRTVLRLYAFDAAGNRSAPSRSLTLVPVRRPTGAPRTIPAWATKLFAWETGSRRGKRPTRPRPLPAWYAPWKAWKLVPTKIR